MKGNSLKLSFEIDYEKGFWTKCELKHDVRYSLTSSYYEPEELKDFFDTVRAMSKVKGMKLGMATINLIDYMNYNDFEYIESWRLINNHGIIKVSQMDLRKNCFDFEKDESQTYLTLDKFLKLFGEEMNKRGFRTWIDNKINN